MKKNFRRLTSVLLAVVLVTSVFSIIPAQAASDDNQSVCASSGTTGDCTWELYHDGLLTINGEGKMYNYTSKDISPFDMYAQKIKSVFLEVE